ncbi:MAG TPA: isocitrate/isopropylmalate dehydrogenase family protein [Gaiella sp.]|jgi:3-isopropylmalate dehydrogenase
MTYEIAVLPGDGIGPEVVAEAVRVLDELERLTGGDLSFALEPYDVGAVVWQRTGEAISTDAYRACEDAHAILFGAAGVPGVRHPDGREVGGDLMFRLRHGLELYAGIRPIRSFRGVPSALRPDAGEIDYVIVRENTEGLYAGRPGGSRVGREVVADTSLVTRAGTSRIARRAFELARTRSGRPSDGVSTVACIDKSNVLASYAFFREVVEEVARDYDDVALESFYVDAAAAYLVQRPTTFDVIVVENMFGDILSDLGAATVGGLGMSPSGDIGDERGLFQAAHGSAPDIAGQGIANPLATVLSAAMMLDWLGHRHGDALALVASDWVELAVRSAVTSAEGRPPDLGGRSTSRDVCDVVLRNLREIVEAT